MKHALILEKLFRSKFANATLVIVLVGLLVGSMEGILSDRQLTRISTQDLRLATWNLTRFDQEASAFDLALKLRLLGDGSTDEMVLRYDILWSRFQYLLDGRESLTTRLHRDNDARINKLFEQFKSIEPLVMSNAQSRDLNRLLDEWSSIREDIKQILIDNFVGDDSSALMQDIDNSRTRLSNLRTIIVAVLVPTILYMLLKMMVLRRENRRDPLTGLANQNALNELKTIENGCSVIACQILNYRALQAELSPTAIDALTVDVSRRLLSILNSDDQLISMHHDEFLIITGNRGMRSIDEWHNLLTPVCSFIWSHRNAQFPIQLAIGIDERHNHRSTWRQRYHKALLARQNAVALGLPLQVHTQGLSEQHQQHQAILNSLMALFNGTASDMALSCHYQPIASIHNAQDMVAAEVLMRAHHKAFGPIAPNVVVDLCERNGLGVKLGHWLFNTIAEECAELFQTALFNGKLTINLSPSLLRPALVDDIQHLLVSKGIPSSALCLEITEDNAALQIDQVNHLINELKDEGVCFALDDFGTGHSSLEYVRELQIHRLKVDRCFVTGIDTVPRNYEFMASLIHLSTLLNIDIIVEGVETQEQWETLSRMGNVYVQGYFLHKPMPIDQLQDLLRLQSASVTPITRDITLHQSAS